SRSRTSNPRCSRWPRPRRCSASSRSSTPPGSVPATCASASCCSSRRGERPIRSRTGWCAKRSTTSRPTAGATSASASDSTRRRCRRWRTTWPSSIPSLGCSIRPPTRRTSFRIWWARSSTASTTPSCTTQGGRRNQHAREHGQPRDEREIRPDAPGPPAAQVLLLERALNHHRRGRQRPRHPRPDSEDGIGRGPQESPHRPADRRDVRPEGRQDRAPDGSQVSRPAEHPAGPHAKAPVSLVTGAATPEVSILVPAKDEVENLPEFVRQAREALLPLPYTCEIVVIDDGSHDGTAETLRDLSAKHPFVRVVTHRSQRGIADALASGADAARGRVLVFYPADLQYRPSDIPGLVQPILDDSADIV